MSQDEDKDYKGKEWEVALINTNRKHHTENSRSHILGERLNCMEVTNLDYTGSLSCKIKQFSCLVNFS